MLRRIILPLIVLFAFSKGNSQVLISILLGDKLNSGKIEFGLDGGWSLSNLEGIKPSKGHSNYKNHISLPVVYN